MVKASGGSIVALALRPDAMEDDCARAAVLVTPWQAPEGCLAQVIDQDRLRREGALALRRTESGAKHDFAVDAVRPGDVDRPWSPAAAEKSTHGGVRSRPARAIDATPAPDDLQPDD